MLKSNYEVEVLINGKPAREFYKDGRHFIEGREGTRYSIRIRNNGSARVLVVPSVDGLSVMNGKEASHKSGGYIVDGYSSITIDGWRRSDKEVAEFLFSDPGQSYASKMGKGGNQGVIGVAVFKEKIRYEPVRPVVIHHTHPCWCNDCYGLRYGLTPQSTTPTINYLSTGGTSVGIKGNVGPSGSVGMSTTNNAQLSSLRSSSFTVSSGVSEALNNSMEALVNQKLGTGWGEDKRSEVVKVEFEAEESPIETFSLYYNTRNELEKMGVEFEARPVYIAPQAFPGEYCEPPKR